MADSRTKYRLLHSTAFALTLVLVLCLVFTPRWQSNDDAGMSMVLHGYGIAARALPNLIYSNILWGYLLSYVPDVGGVLGYSVATIGILFICATAMSFFSTAVHGKNWYLPLMIILVLSRPIVFPHFTINAGLLTVCAVLGMRVYALQRDRASLLLSFVLLFLGCLIRKNEAFLVLLVAFPLVISRELMLDRRFQLGVLIFVGALLSSMAIDDFAYAGEAWRPFKQLADVIGPYVDFGAGVRIEARPDIYGHFGFSKNDIELVRNWFFVDSEIANPTSLRQMLSELGPLPGQPGSNANGYAALMSLIEKPLLPLFVAAFGMLLCSFSVRLLCAWCIFAGSLYVLGFSGRAGTLHVYLPLLAVLLLVPVQTRSLSVLKIICLLFAVLSNLYILRGEQVIAKKEMALTQESVAYLVGKRVVNWGDYFSFQNAFPVLSSNAKLRELSIYSLGSFTLAPFSVTATAEREESGMKALLRSSAEVQILASDYQLNLLRIYCKERKWGELQVVSLAAGSLPLRSVKCA